MLDIIADTDGALWISTMQGVYRYTPGAGQAPFYELSGGAFARLDYNLGSCFDADGTLFLGGINGITYFDPRQVGRPDEAAKVYVSGVSVLNRDIVPDGVHLEASINRSHRLTLNYDDYQLSLDFTTLTFAPENRERFYYRIDGMTPDWIPLGETNRLSFSNLARGEYMLRVKAADASGLLGEGSTDILITVLPPWWLTWWAYCIYGALALLLAAAVVWVILIRYRAAQQVRMVQYKQQLFINLTHGLKTPLTMMQVPLQLMSDDREPLSDEARRGLLVMISSQRQEAGQHGPAAHGVPEDRPEPGVDEPGGGRYRGVRAPYLRLFPGAFRIEGAAARLRPSRGDDRDDLRPREDRARTLQPFAERLYFHASGRRGVCLPAPQRPDGLHRRARYGYRHPLGVPRQDLPSLLAGA